MPVSPASAVPDPPSRITSMSSLRPVAGGSTPLPRPLTQLIGREHDVDAVTALLHDPEVRLLTLTGPGGVGKTRLVIAAANAAASSFPGGVVFVDLSPVADHHLVLGTIAAALRLRDTGGGSLHERVVTAIADRTLLLVIDNFEQVVQAAMRVRALLDTCPALTLLITSRIRLRISGEREYPVAPLLLDDPENGEESGAIRLFYERARAVRPDFDPAHESLPVIGDIVRRVDGLPLAIELAAARIKALPPVALLQRLEQQLPLLSGGARDLPLRQQTMRDTIGWSHDLLDAREYILFRRLGVFVGGFTLDAAEAIVAGSPEAGFEVIDGIAELIDHSLLRQRTDPDGEPRYRMLETVREYALGRLASANERDEVQRRHAGFFLAYAASGDTERTAPHQVSWLARMDTEQDNLRAALHWALGQGESERGLATSLGAVLWPYWERRGWLGEGRAHLARIVALPPDPDLLAERSWALTGAGVLAALQGDYDPAIHFCEQALTGWRQLGDQRGVARVLLCLATIARFRDDYAGAFTMGQESLAAYRNVDDRWGTGHVRTHLGMVAWVQGDHAAGIAHYEEALADLRAAGDEAGIFEVLLELGKGVCDAGDLPRATKQFEECLGRATAMGDETGRGAVLTELGVVARLQGDHDRAQSLLQEATMLAQHNGDRRQLAYLAAHLADVDLATGAIASALRRYAAALELFRDMGNRAGIAQCLVALARCARLRGEDLPAVRFLGAAAALYTITGATPPPDRDPDIDAGILKPHLSPGEFAAAWTAGQTLQVDEAIAEALLLAGRLEAEGDGLASAPEASPSTALPDPPVVDALGLTPREIEVLRLLAEGMSDREIAGALSISERTAGNHVQHAMQKIGVESRTAAAVFAVRHGLA